MKNNRLLYLLFFILVIWLALQSNEINKLTQVNSTSIVNEYNVNGFSTDFTSIVEDNAPAIVSISADGTVLSGFVYKQDDDRVFIVTAYHGVAGAENINVHFGSSYSVTGALVGHDIYTDVAIISIDTPYDVSALKTGDASLLKKGEFVVSIGSLVSLDYAGTVSLAMISDNLVTVENIINVDAERYIYNLDLIETDTVIANGYSGSPLINMAGEFVGMNTMAYNTDFSLAVTSNEIRIIAENIINGIEPIRNILGIKGTFVKDMYNYERVNLNISLETIGGFYVSRVRESSIAHDAGIRAGDVITAINGISINGLNDYLGVIHTPAETFSFDYIRGAETFHQEINND